MRIILQFIRQTKKKSVISALETSSSLLFGWFINNFMKANSDLKAKNHLIMSCTEETAEMTDGFSSDSSKKRSFPRNNNRS